MTKMPDSGRLPRLPCTLVSSRVRIPQMSPLEGSSSLTGLFMCEASHSICLCSTERQHEACWEGAAFSGLLRKLETGASGCPPPPLTLKQTQHTPTFVPRICSGLYMAAALVSPSLLA